MISCLWLLGAVWPAHVRELVWALAIAVDLLGGALGFYTPGLGRSRTWDWTIEGTHFAERCQAFILIALGESIVVIGASLSSLHTVTGSAVAAFLIAFVGSAALWWIYFDRSAEEGAHQTAASHDPGRLGRSAYVFVHPIMVAGIIVAAAADAEVLAHPSRVGDAATAWMVLGGAALFLAGHALFTAVVWRVTPWSRIVAISVLALLEQICKRLNRRTAPGSKPNPAISLPARFTFLHIAVGLLAPHVSALALGICAAAVVVGVAGTDRLRQSDVDTNTPHPAHTQDVAEG